HTVLAEVLLKQGRVADAEEELRTALSLDAAHSPARLLMARIAEARDRPVEARNHLRAAIEGDPQDPDSYRELVRLELSLGNLAAAEEMAGKLSEASRSAQDREQRQQHDEEPDDSRGGGRVVAGRLRGQGARAQAARSGGRSSGLGRHLDRARGGPPRSGRRAVARGGPAARRAPQQRRAGRAGGSAAALSGPRRAGLLPRDGPGAAPPSA